MISMPHHSNPPPRHYSIPKMVREVGIAPTSPRLQRGANLPQLLGVLAHGEGWSSRAVTLRGLPLIRVIAIGHQALLLCYMMGEWTRGDIVVRLLVLGFQ